jgi:hypothetical protein
MRFLVAHAGVPIGAVDLPDGRRWAGGLLMPFAAFAAVQPAIAAASAAGAEIALDVLTLPAGGVLDVGALDPAIAAAVTRLTTLVFELRDEAGLAVATDVVRLADPGDGRGVRVRAFFWQSPAGAPAVPQRAPRRDGGAEPPGV